MSLLRLSLSVVAILAFCAPVPLHAEPVTPASKLPRIPDVDGKLVDLSDPGVEAVVVAIFPVICS